MNTSGNVNNFVETLVKSFKKRSWSISILVFKNVLYITITSTYLFPFHRSIRDLDSFVRFIQYISNIEKEKCMMVHCKGRDVLRSNQAEYTGTITHALARLLYICGRMCIS